MNDPRSEQFKGYAKALFEELKPDLLALFLSLSWKQENDVATFEALIQQRMSRRTYDLVQHTIGHTLEYLDECGRQIPGGMGKRIAPSIPDMAELPKEEEHGE